MEHVLASNPYIQSGKTTLLAQGAGLANHQLTIGSVNALTFGEVDESSGLANRRQRRKLAATSGELSVLVVRVTTADSSLTKQTAEISGDVFGTNGSGDTINLKSVVEDCSNDVLRINPGDGNGSYCVDTADAVFDVPRNDAGFTYDCDFFNDYQFNTPGDLCFTYGNDTQVLPTVDGKEIKAPCWDFGLLSFKEYNTNVFCLLLHSLTR